MESVLFLSFYYFCIFMFSSSIELTLAADTVSPEMLIRDGEVLVSSGQRFELGFFSPGSSSNRYLGIWYRQIPETAVWVANRNNPITDTNGVLTIGDNGNLVLLNKTKSIVWSSNISGKVENPVAQLLDTGNLVLVDNVSSSTSESYLWQSFDHPSDTLLPGMRLGWYLKVGLERYLTSWRSMDDPSLGEFTFRLDINVLPQMFLYRGSMKIARTGPWNGVFLGGVPTEPNLLFEPVVVNNEDECSYRYESFNDPIVMLLKLDQSGMIRWEIWNKMTSGWDFVYSAPEDVCGNYGNCGANSICSIDKTPVCECLKGFTPKSQNNLTSSEGCVRSSPLDCEGEDRFVMLGGIKLPDLLDVSLHENMSLKECEAECLKNCTCRAYANSNKTRGGSGCLMWFRDLIDLRKLVETRGTQDIYIRVPASELVAATDKGDQTNIKGRRQLLLIILPIMSLTLAALGLIFLYVRKKTKKGENLLLFDLDMNLQGDHAELAKEIKLGKNSRKEAKLPLFSFASVCAATDNFSAINKLGEGGFGSVYKGTLLKGDKIAVKRLSRRSGQGWEEFKNEALLIAQLQHKNLVRILGYCIEHDEKILIYEYLSNKSLDFFLFDPFKRNLLGWEKCVRIVEGIAQGLLYLHEHSRLRIIHRDLKASNILLDEDMNPKISDFGMARIFGGNDLQANTNRIVGTYGYMSPEYALEGLFSIKSDVFSFGVLLLEIVSGKKNTGFYQTNSLNLLGYAWDLWTSDRGLELMDPVPEEASHKHMLLRYVNIALLCVQERAVDRPTMSDVMSMLTNQIATLPSPERPAFTHLRSTVNSNIPLHRAESCSTNDITVTILEAR